MKLYEKTFFGENSKINFSEGPKNGETIILIHGFLGWGRDEMAGYFC